jgi:DNA-binding response OmpR family regulator
VNNINRAVAEEVMQKILLIDDDDQLGELLSSYFSRFAIECVNAVTPSLGYQQLQSQEYELVILDVMLPEQDGFEVCKQIRKTSDIPIVMLTARGDVMDRIVGLEIGADDYLAKPFEPRELLVRIQTILKRTQKKAVAAPLSTLQFGDLRIEQLSMQVTINGDTVSLSAMEYQLLVLLALSPHVLFSRDDILHALKGVDTELFSRSVDILVSRLRQKLKPLQLIKTVRSRGYIFVENVENAS